MASNGDKLSVTAKKSGENSAGENPKKIVDLNSAEPDPTEDITGAETVAASAAIGVSAEDEGEKKDETVSEVVISSAGNVSGDKSPVNDIQKKIRRAERFGLPVQLSEEEKRNSRAERFGSATVVKDSEATKKSEDLKRKARAERFGLPVSSAPTNEESKKKARLARFGTDNKVDSAEEEKRKARALRFSKPVSTSSSDLPGEQSFGQEAAVSGKAA